MDRKMWPTGDRALLTPACNGARTVSTSSCTLRSGPLLPWRKSRVTTVTLAASRAARTTRDLVALRYEVLLKATSRTTLGEAAGSVAARSDEHRLQRLEFLQTFAGTDGHARQRVLGQMHGHPGLMLEALVEPLQEGASAGQHDSLVHDVCSQFRGRPVERRLHGVDDRVHRLLDGSPDLLRRHDDGLRQPGDEVAPADLGIRLVGEGEGRADRHLDLLGGALPERQRVLLLDVGDDRLVELVPTDPDGEGGDDAPEGDHRHLGGAATDVDDHVAGL